MRWQPASLHKLDHSLGYGNVDGLANSRPTNLIYATNIVFVGHRTKGCHKI